MITPDSWLARPRRDAPFIGREAELSVIEQEISAVRTDGARLVLLVGDAGVGKSRLTQEACSLLPGDERVAVGGCVHLPGVPGAQVPFGPFVEALRRLDLSDDPAAEDALARWLSPEGRPDRDDDPFSTRSARMLDLVARLSSDRPLVLVLEDFHWADSSSLELLVFLVRNLTTQPVLILVTSRPPTSGSPFGASYAHLRRLPSVATLSVDPLPDDDVRLIVTGCAADGLDETQLAAIVTRAEGNPLAACELATTLAQLDGRGPWLPPTFEASVLERVRAASPAARAVLAGVAVVGEIAEPRVLRSVLSAALPALDRSGYVAALAKATETGLLEVHETGYAFRHGLERDSVYADLGPDDRQWWHAQAARAWIEHGNLAAPGMAARIASHCEMAGDAEWVRTYSLAAARTATAMAAFTEAVAQYERMLDHWPVNIRTPRADGGPGSDLLLEVADAALWAHRLDYCLSLARTAVAAAADSDEADSARERLAHLIGESGDNAAAAAICDVALAAMNDATGTAAARTLATQAGAFMMLYRYAEAARAARASLDCTTDPGDVSRASAWVTLGHVAAMTGDAQVGLELMERGRIHAATHGHDQQLWRAVVNHSHVLISMGRYEEAALNTMAVLKTSDPAASRSVLMINAVDALIHLGQWQRAQTLIDDFFQQPHAPFGVVWLRPSVANLHLLRGDQEAAERVLADARSSAGEVPDPEQTLALNLVSARFALDTGELRIARSAISDVILEVAAIGEDAQPMIEALALAARIEAEAQRGRPGFDPANIARLRELLATTVEQLHAHQAHLHFEAAMCAAELDRAEGSDQVFTWKSVCERALELRRPYDHAYALLRLAEAALLTRQRTVALESLSEASTTAVRLGAAPLEELVRKTAQRHRLPLEASAPSPARPRSASRATVLGLPLGTPDARPTGPDWATMDDLTERELEVLRQLPAPLSQRELAASLYVSSNTLKVHLRRIYRKLGVTSREDAVRRARTLGLLDGH